jgi:copper chaperone NosL
MKKHRISVLSKALLLLTALLFIGALFVPMWQIQLEAPQYPEGLVLQLYANKIGGDVDIINGLNHYIGMATLHTENFPEFLVSPYVFGVFALISAALVFLSNKKYILIFGVVYVVFIALAAVDFYRWNYEYGHNLDPNAAIKVPGMAYQPPLIGYKQLLNFAAYSIPDTGGWLLSLALVFICVVLLKEYKFTSKKVS